MTNIFEVPKPGNDLLEKADKVRLASIKISQTENIDRIKALNFMADCLEKNSKEILEANSEDYKKAEKKGISKALLSRLKLSKDKYDRKLEDKEKELIKQIDLFPSAISAAASSHNPALVANYVYDLVKSFNSFYQSLPILKSAFEDKKTFRVELSKLVGITIKNALSLLGIGVVDRM